MPYTQLPEMLLEQDRELDSLLQLLDDPDSRIATAVENRLRSKGPGVIIPLLEFVHLSPDATARARAHSIVQEFNEILIADEFEKLAPRLDAGDLQALEDGAFLIARYGNSGLDIGEYRRQLDHMAQMLKARLVGQRSPIEQLSTINKFFFSEMNFHGNHTNFMDAGNSYLDRVLERRLGIPISLSVIYLLLTEHRLRLPFSGASAPGHFLIRFDGTSQPLFIDAFNGGILLRERDIRRFLEASRFPFSETFLTPAEPRSVLLRMMRNLLKVFQTQDDLQAISAFEKFIQILSPETADSQTFLKDLEE